MGPYCGMTPSCINSSVVAGSWIRLIVLWDFFSLLLRISSFCGIFLFHILWWLSLIKQSWGFPSVYGSLFPLLHHQLSHIFLLLLMQALEVGYLNTMLVCSGPPCASPSLLLLFLSTVSVLEVLTVLGLWAFISAWQVQHVQPLRVLPEFKLSHQLQSHPSAIHQYGLALQWTEAAAYMSDAWIWIFINRLGWLSVNRWHWTYGTLLGKTVHTLSGIWR